MQRWGPRRLGNPTRDVRTPKRGPRWPAENKPVLSPATDEDKTVSDRGNNNLTWEHGGGDLDWFEVQDLDPAVFSVKTGSSNRGSNPGDKVKFDDNNQSDGDYTYYIQGAHKNGTQARHDPVIRNRG